MAEYVNKYCVVSELTSRQKIMATKLLRDSAENVIAMDAYNAKVKELSKNAEIAVMFMPYSGMDPTEEELDLLEDLGWSVGRILVEGEDFEVGELPGKLKEKGSC